VVAPTESGVVVAAHWESAAARDDYQSHPSTAIFEDADLSLR
jgi:hypothetical protein